MSDALNPASIRERANGFARALGFGPEEARIIADAIDIADESSIALLESELRISPDGWFDLTTAADPLFDEKANQEIQATVDHAVNYLTARGLLERHPEKPWVRMKEPSV